jgi:PPP family 3-phenylpropionic acid transporter
MLSNANIPYWRLSGFYFFYFAFLGAWVPFWNLYLESELHFSASQIGILSALVLGTKIIGPYLWGWLSDHFGKRIEIIRVGAFFAFVIFFAVFWRQDFWALFFIVAVYSFFLNAVLSQFEVVTLSHLKEHSHRYTQIRVWGSVGFILTVFGLGYFFEVFGLHYLLYFFVVLLGGVFFLSLFVKESGPLQELTAPALGHSSFKQFTHLLQQPSMVVFFIACFLVQFSHGPYYTFYTIYLEQLGYERALIGMLWSLGVLAEVVLFMFMPRLFERYILRFLLLVTLAITAVRWLLIAAFADVFLVLVFAQLMHAASFGSFHAIAVETVGRHFKSPTLGQGQAFYSAVSFGAGGAAGALLSGYFWHYGANVVFLGAFGAVIIAWVVVYLLNE